VQEHDASGLRAAAHTLKGSVASLGGVRAYRAALGVETLGRDADLSAAPEAIGKLEHEIRLLGTELEHFRQGTVHEAACC
jgi:HPt (histidine-containing phosphotransfer) domain-containing protein